MKYPHKTVCRIFEAAESEQGMRPIDRLILEEYIIDILFFFNESHKDCAKQLEALPIELDYDHILIEVISPSINLHYLCMR